MESLWRGGIADFLKYVGYRKKTVKARGWDRMGMVGGGGMGIEHWALWAACQWPMPSWDWPVDFVVQLMNLSMRTVMILW